MHDTSKVTSDTHILYHRRDNKNNCIKLKESELC